MEVLGLLSEYDLRRPLTATGTNLLGLVKHLASVEVGCFAWAFDRLLGETLWWLVDDAEPNADMWATEDEPSQEIFGVYERARAHADTTIEDLPLDTGRGWSLGGSPARRRCTKCSCT